MDRSKINQTQLDFSCGEGLAKLNLKTGRLLFECPGLTIGANNYQIETSLIYNSQIKDFDFKGLKIGLGNGWKLNVQEYVFPYNTEYNLPEFKDGDYVYIDSNWNIRRFVKYKSTNSYGDNRSIYYDASGSGLRLLTGKDRYPQIYDGNNSIIKFDLKGRINYIISSINANIIKKIDYNGDNLISIYDTRKSGRKINFEYNKGLLKKISSDTYNVSLNLTYNDLNKLEKVTKVNGTNTKDYMYLKYDVAGTLSHVINSETLRALYFEKTYEGSNVKISKIIEGAMKKKALYDEQETEQFLERNQYIGASYYVTNMGKKVKGYELILPNEYIKNVVTITYTDNYTDVTNEKNIKIRYFFNNNGFTSSILEVDENDNNNLKTLFKTCGWNLTNDGMSPYKINGHKAIMLKESYTYYSNNIASFINIFEKYENGEKKKNEYTENFVLSFWLKSNKDINCEVKAKVFIKKDLNEKEYGKTIISKTLKDSWQYVTIPISIGENQESIEHFKIDFEGLNNSEELYLADLRIAISDGNGITNFFNDSLNISSDKMTGISYVEDGIEKCEVFSSDFFLTDSDIFATYKSLYYKEQKEQELFDLVYCNGSKVKSVSSVKIIENENKIQLVINNGMPNYYTSSLNRVAKKRWSITKTSVRFYKEESNKFYYETKVAVEVVNKSNKEIDEEKAAITYEWQNANGTFRAKKDEYSVVTENIYDNYGNLITIKIYNEAEAEKECLTTTYDFGEVDEKYREMPLSCTSNGVKKEFSYNEPHFATNYTLEDNSQINYDYNIFNDKVTSIECKDNRIATIEYKNTIKYDNYGRIKSISDLSNRIYGYIYNAFGDPIKYYENGRLISAKTVEKENDKETIKEKIYNNEQVVNGKKVNNPYENITEINKYGQIISQINKVNENDPGNKISFYYNSVDESKSVSNVSRIFDPYEEVTYNYIYDDENRPSGYRINKNSSNEKEMQVRQIGEGDTQYYFNNGNEYIMSKIVKEDSEVDEGENKKFIQPRTKRTNYVKMDGENSDKFEEIYEDYNFEYTYDKLGRLLKKTNLKSYMNDYNSNSIKIDKELTYENGKTTASKLEYKECIYGHTSTNEAKLTYDNVYNKKNIITQVSFYGKRIIQSKVVENDYHALDYVSRDYNYEYDAFDRLVKETRKDDNMETLKIEYDYYKNSGNLRSVSKNGNIYKRFKYENGRKTEISLGGVNYPIEYDNYGNIKKDIVSEIKYNSRNLLETYHIGATNNGYLPSGFLKKCDYYYNYQGVRYKKKIEESQTKTKYIKYYLDGNRILGEDWSYSDGTLGESFRYFYDIEGITGLRYKGYNFVFLKDPLGNVSKIMNCGKVIGEYVYDAWGNCKIIELIDESNEEREAIEKFILYNNPFRWKSHYLDLESDLYYVNGRFYSITLMQYLNADNIERIKPSEVNSLDRHAITLNNSITYEVNSDSIYTNDELFADPKYDPIKDKSWWSLNWKKAIQKIVFLIVYIVSFVLMCIPPTNEFGALMFAEGLKWATSGAIISGIIGGIVSACNGNGFMDGFAEGAVDGFINGFTSGALMFCASEAISALSKTPNTRCTSPGNCFVAGTVVQTTLGNKKIEDIKLGDEVWAYNEKTGKKELKKVTNLFRNKTKKWVQLSFEFNDGTIEKIKCTERHPFYVDNLGWINAIDLLVNDKVLMYDNNVANLIEKEIEELNTEEETYNFEVQDYHTYYVGKKALLVHNDCDDPDWLGSYEIDFSDGRKYIGKGKEARAEQSAKKICKDNNVTVVGKIDWKPSSVNTHKQAFIDEYNRMEKVGFDPNKNGLRSKNPTFYNRIWSPGKKISK